MKLNLPTLSPKVRAILPAYVQIVLGCLIGGIAYPLFLTPSSIAPGGLTGISTILYHHFRWPVGITSLAMNIPLFIIGWKKVGRLFAFRSLIATFLFSFTIDLLQVKPATDDPLLASLFGGILLGAGLGLIMRGQGTTGGTDMIARIIHHKFSFVSTGVFMIGLDMLVVLLVTLFIGANEALYALISIYVSGKVADTVMIGFTANKACYIISNRWDNISGRILHSMERGATLLEARGAWTRDNRPVILCVVARQEIPMLKTIVREEDPSAFMIVTDAHEAMGEGFKPLDEDE